MSHGGNAGISPDEAEAYGNVLTLPNDDVAEALKNHRQGDVLEAVRVLAVTADDGSSIDYATPHGIVLVSQTCDIVQPNRPAVAAAPLIYESNAARAAEARNGKRPALIHLPAIGDNAFADLNVVGTISKRLAATHSPRHGVETDGDVRRFAQALGRKFSRFAFPDEVVPWLAPLERILSSKAVRPGSPEGQVLALVDELRIEASPGWMSAGPWELTLVVIVQAGVLPWFSEADLPDLPDTLAAWLKDEQGELRRQVPELAGRLISTSDPIEQYWLWQLLGEAWTARCVPDGKWSQSVHDAVVSIVGEVVMAGEYTYDRFQRSERLDLDYLSEPLPR